MGNDSFRESRLPSDNQKILDMSSFYDGCIFFDVKGSHTISVFDHASDREKAIKVGDHIVRCIHICEGLDMDELERTGEVCMKHEESEEIREIVGSLSCILDDIRKKSSPEERKPLWSAIAHGVSELCVLLDEEEKRLLHDLASIGGARKDVIEKLEALIEYGSGLKENKDE